MPPVRLSHWLVLLAFAAVTAFFVVAVPLQAEWMRDMVRSAGTLAPVAFGLLMIFGILFSPIPTSPLTLMAPGLFGVWPGFLLVLTSATLGATIAFGIGRFAGKRFFTRFPEWERHRHLLPPNITAWAVFLLRLPPSPTFDAVSYLSGLTDIRPWQFVLATFFGQIPVTAALCFAGSVIPGAWLWPLLAAGLAFALWQWWRKRTAGPAG